MYWLFVTAAVVALSSIGYLLRLLRCRLWEGIDGSIVQSTIYLSWVRWNHWNPEDVPKSASVFCQWCCWNYNFGASSSSLQFSAAQCSAFSSLCHVPGYIVPPCLFNYLIVGFFVLFCVLFIYCAYLVYWMVKWMPAQGKQQGVGVWKETGGKQNWRSWLVQHQQDFFLRGRIGTVFRGTYLLIFSKGIICEAIFAETAVRKVLKIFSFFFFFLQWQLFVSSPYPLPSFCFCHTFEKISEGKLCSTNVSQIVGPVLFLEMSC